MRPSYIIRPYGPGAQTPVHDHIINSNRVKSGSSDPALPVVRVIYATSFLPYQWISLSDSMASFGITILALVVISLLAVYRIILYPIFFSPLSRIPNAHWSAPIAPIWILWTRYNRRENRSVHAAHVKHGPVVRLGPKELSVNDVGGVRSVYGGGFEKGEWYSLFDN